MSRDKSIAVVGAGLTGLFCALVLRQQGHDVVVYERSSRVGGSLKSLRLDRHNCLLGDDWSGSELDVYFDEGISAVDLNREPLVSALLERLDITSVPTKDIHLVNLQSSLITRPSPEYHRERYNELAFAAGEQGRSSQSLLLLAVARILSRLEIHEPSRETTASVAHTSNRLSRLCCELAMALASGESEVFVLQRWAKEQLDDSDLWLIQTCGYFGQTPLYGLGCWNLLSEVLSASAVQVVRANCGEFAGSAENCNAAQWLICVLRSLSSSPKVAGVNGGMQGVIENLMATPELRDLVDSGHLKPGHTVVGIGRTGSNWELECLTTGGVAVRFVHSRVVLALPSLPLRELLGRNLSVVSQLDPGIMDLVDSAKGVCATRVFAVIEPTLIPGEDLGVSFDSGDSDLVLELRRGKLESIPGVNTGRRVAVSLSANSTASTFWENYARPGARFETDMFKDPRLHHRLRSSVARFLSAQYQQHSQKGDGSSPAKNSISTSQASELAEQISWCGIRKWNDDSAFVHYWRPGRRWWVVQRRLSEVGLNSGLHVCSEAYSDQQGTLEGCLRSAIYVLHRISGQGNALKRTLPSWLEEALPEIWNGKQAERNATALLQWIEELDELGGDEEFEHLEYSNAIEIVIHTHGSGWEVVILQLGDPSILEVLTAPTSSQADKMHTWHRVTKTHRLAAGSRCREGVYKAVVFDAPGISAGEHIVAVAREERPDGRYWIKAMDMNALLLSKQSEFWMHPTASASEGLVRGLTRRGESHPVHEQSRGEDLVENVEGGNQARIHRKAQPKEKPQGKQKSLHVKHKTRVRTDSALDHSEREDEREQVVEGVADSEQFFGAAGGIDACFGDEGEPLLLVKPAAGGVILSQYIFSYAGINPAQKPYHLAVNYQCGNGGSVNESSLIVKNLECSLELPQGTRLLFLNAGGRGAFKTKYDATFKFSLDSVFDPAERLCYLRDSWALVLAGDCTDGLAKYLDLLSEFRSDGNKAVWSFILFTLNCLNLVIDPRMRSALCTKVQFLLEDLYDRCVPLTPEQEYPILDIDDDSEERERNGMVFQASAILGNFAEAQSRALSWFESYKNGMSIDPPFVAPVLNIVAYAQPHDDLEKATKTYEYMLGLFQQAKKWSKHDADILRGAFAYFRHPKLLQRTLESCISPDLDTVDGEALFRTMLSTPWGRGPAWEFLTEVRSGGKRCDLRLVHLIPAFANLIVDSTGTRSSLIESSAAFEAGLQNFLEVNKQECRVLPGGAAMCIRKLALAHAFKIREFEQLEALFKQTESENETEIDDGYPISPL